MDFIFIEGFQGEARVGIYEHERAAPQPVEIDLKLGLPADAASRDDIEDTICYATLSQRLREILVERHYDLLETLCERIVALAFNEFPAAWARVSISKPGILPGIRRVGVQIERTRKN